MLYTDFKFKRTLKNITNKFTAKYPLALSKNKTENTKKTTTT